MPLAPLRKEHIQLGQRSRAYQRSTDTFERTRDEKYKMARRGGISDREDQKDPESQRQDALASIKVCQRPAEQQKPAIGQSVSAVDPGRGRAREMQRVPNCRGRS